MSKIFLSYSSKDIERAGVIVKALENEGYCVFWDTEIPVGETWDEYIGEKLDNAEKVVVLWTENSVKRRWVREEARKALRDKKLIPVMLEDVSLPLGFGSIQSIKLIDWDGQSNRFFDKLLSELNNRDSTTKSSVSKQNDILEQPSQRVFGQSEDVIKVIERAKKDSNAFYKVLYNYSNEEFLKRKKNRAIVDVDQYYSGIVGFGRLIYDVTRSTISILILGGVLLFIIYILFDHFSKS